MVVSYWDGGSICRVGVRSPLCSPLSLQLLGRLEEQGDELHPCRDVVELGQAEEGLWQCPAVCGVLAAPSPVLLFPRLRCQHIQGPRVKGGGCAVPGTLQAQDEQASHALNLWQGGWHYRRWHP